MLDEALTLRRAGVTAPALALLLAPGLPLHESFAAAERAAGELRCVLAAPVPVCLDADALTLLDQDGPRWAPRTPTASPAGSPPSPGRSRPWTSPRRCAGPST